MTSTWLTDLRRLAEQLCWVVLLFVLAAMSFVSQPYQSVPWMLLSTVFYSLCSVYILLLMFGANFNRRAVYESRWLILVALTGLLWLYLQSVFPYENEFRRDLFRAGAPPEWFVPASLVSIDPERTRQLFLAYLLPFGCMLLCLAMITDRSRIKSLLLGLLALGLLHATIASMAKYQQFYLVDIAQLDGHWSAARGWFVNRNHFAAFMVICSFGPLALILKPPRSAGHNVLRILAILVGLVIAGALILSQSRGGLLSFGLLMILTLFALPALATRAKISLQSNVKNRFLMLISMALIATLGLLLFGQEILQRLLQGSFSLGERALQWQITWHAIQQSPWLGYGGGSYAPVFQLIREFADLRQVVFDQAHNEYLHLWLEQGLLGLSLWLVLIGMLLRRSLLVYGKTRSSLVAAVLAAGTVVIIAASLQAFVDFNLQIINLRCYFFVIIATVLAAPTISQNQ